eukprot:CAMPEP_0119048452 /NCGR_PEP_ID=MMETSP1177-20130426/58902_1 /TAXON_ID=2985 /ORGANISM="Ochromonas sp, Strain CCMP1899" /LENGTH=137 /DNA_ID=CAMNT_0007024329 /DNA_START=404 /DNA_END=814 /DNA_ORIENTATION=-
MWIEYADMVRTPGEIFAFMQSNKIGEKVALFWIAWAFVAEKNLNFKLADQIFQKGMRRQCEPKDMLTKRYQQFQRRLARQYLNNIEETGEAHIPNPISTTGNHGNSGNTVDENRVNRNVLGGLTTAQSETTDRHSST